jgi:hypothetical protein
MRKTKVGLTLVVLLMSFLPAVAKDKKTITVTGRLVHAAGIGGESTGWMIQLDNDAMINGNEMDSIEVMSTSKKLDEFANQRVKAKGRLTTQHSVERGDRTVLDIRSIKELQVKTKS